MFFGLLSFATIVWSFLSPSLEATPHINKTEPCLLYFDKPSFSEAQRDELVLLHFPKLLLEGLTIEPTKSRAGKGRASQYFISEVDVNSSSCIALENSSIRLISILVDGTLYPRLLLLEPLPSAGLMPSTNRSRGQIVVNLVPTAHSPFGQRLADLQQTFIEICGGRTESLFGSSPKEVLVNDPLTRQVAERLPQFPTVFHPNNMYVEALLNATLPRLQGGQRALVLGSGSGHDALMVAKRTQNTVHAVDINPLAVANTKLTARYGREEGHIEAWQSDLFSEVSQQYDVIVFDAPLAISSRFAHLFGQTPAQFEATKFADDPNLHDFDAKLLSRLLSEVPKYLRPEGKLYLMTYRDLSGVMPANLRASIIGTVGKDGLLAIQEISTVEGN